MNNSSITIKAGTKAIELIRKNGLNAKDVKSISAAAGGPKWFVIYHLTKYIGEHILPHTEGRVQLLGSSVGAWQMACLASPEPTAALTRLRDHYAGEEYFLPITVDEVSRGCNATLFKTLSDEDIAYIVQNEKVNLNIFAAQGKGIMNSTNKYAVQLGLAFNFMTNAASRKTVDWLFRRHIFSTHTQMPIIPEKSQLQTVLKELNAENFRECLMATAAIPLVMNGVDNVSNAPNKIFWDGGLSDYHMALPYKEEGLVLLPHFLPDITPGWMDKVWKTRRGNGTQLSNTVLLHPSEKYVKSLPKGKITTRDDFMEYGENQVGRAEYWTAVSERGKEMSEELDDLINTGRIAEVVQPL